MEKRYKHYPWAITIIVSALVFGLLTHGIGKMMRGNARHVVATEPRVGLEPLWEKHGDVYRALVPGGSTPIWLEVTVRPGSVHYYLWEECFDEKSKRTGRRSELDWVHGFPIGWMSDCRGNKALTRERLRENEKLYGPLLPKEARKIIKQKKRGTPP